MSFFNETSEAKIRKVSYLHYLHYLPISGFIMKLHVGTLGGKLLVVHRLFLGQEENHTAIMLWGTFKYIEISIFVL